MNTQPEIGLAGLGVVTSPETVSEVVCVCVCVHAYMFFLWTMAAANFSKVPVALQTSSHCHLKGVFL